MTLVCTARHRACDLSLGEGHGAQQAGGLRCSSIQKGLIVAQKFALVRQSIFVLAGV
jgi:hypothetical protein